MEPKKSNAITVIKHLSLITREIWIDCLGLRVRLAVSSGGKNLKIL